MTGLWKVATEKCLVTHEKMPKKKEEEKRGRSATPKAKDKSKDRSATPKSKDRSATPKSKGKKSSSPVGKGKSKSPSPGKGGKSKSPAAKGKKGKRSPSPKGKKGKGAKGKKKAKAKAKGTAVGKAKPKKEESPFFTKADLTFNKFVNGNESKNEGRLRFPRIHSDSSLLAIASRPLQYGYHQTEDDNDGFDPYILDRAIEHLDEDINQRGYAGYAPLHLSCAQPTHVDLTSLFLTYGAHPGVPSTGGHTPLHFAAASGGPVQVALLLRNQVLNGEIDINAQNAAGWTPLMCALSRTGISQVSTVSQLIAGKSDVNYVNEISSRETPLHLACRHNQDCASMLIEAKASVKDKNAIGNTALHLAAKNYGGKDVIQLLIGAKCDPMLKNNAEKTALDLATNSEGQSMLRVLTESRREAAGVEDYSKYKEVQPSSAWNATKEEVSLFFKNFQI